MQKYRFHSNERCHTNLGPVVMFLSSVIALVLAMIKVYSSVSELSALVVLLELVLVAVFFGAWSIPAFAALYKYKVMKERSIILEVMVGVFLLALQVFMVLGLYWLDVRLLSWYTAVATAGCGGLSWTVYSLCFQSPNINNN